MAHDVKFIVTFDDKGAYKSIQQFDKAVDDLGKTAKDKASPALGGLWKQFALGEIAGRLAYTAARKLTTELMSTVKAAMEQENADKALSTALELTGREVDRNTQHFKRYASSLQNATVYADDQIQSVQSLLIQMTSLSREGIDRATRGTIGLASTMRMDLFSAAQLVQKAIEGNFGALSRYGIKVDETLSLEEKRAQLLEKLEGMFGRAQAETETFEGKVKQLNLAWGDFKDKVGEAVTKSGLLKTALEGLTSTIQTLTQEAEPLPERLSFWEKLASGVSGAIGPMAQAAATVKKFSNETYVLEESWRTMSNIVLTGRRAAIDPLPAKIMIIDTAIRKAVVENLPPMREWVRLWTRYGMITTEIGETPLPGSKQLPEAQWQWLGFGETITETASLWDSAMLSMTAGLVSFGDANASVWSNIGSVFGNFLQSALSGLESLWIRQIMVSKGIIKAKQGEATASHISNIFKSVPFPLDLILAAGAFAVVNSLFSKLLKFEKGGYFPSATMLPAHLVGEGGPEYYLPERTLERTMERVIVEKGGGGGAVNVVFGQGAFIINAQTLDERVIDSIAPRLYKAIGDQMRIHGRRWN